MRNMYANHLARGGGSTFLRGKGRKSAMTASPSFKGGCDYSNILAIKVFQISARVWREIITFERRGKDCLVQFT